MSPRSKVSKTCSCEQNDAQQLLQMAQMLNSDSSSAGRQFIFFFPKKEDHKFSNYTKKVL